MTSGRTTDLYYILDGRKAVPVDLMTWAGWFEKNGTNTNRHVAGDTIDEVRIRTIFLGIDLALGEGPPMIFKTRVFGGPLDQEQDHCSTWEEAEAMHARMKKRVIKAQITSSAHQLSNPDS